MFSEVLVRWLLRVEVKTNLSCRVTAFQAQDRLIFLGCGRFFEKKKNTHFAKHAKTKTHARALSTHGRKERIKDSHEPCLALILHLPLLEK